MAEDIDWDDFDDDEEELGWSVSYFAICILMPTFNGFINGYSWSGYALHYTSMGWPLARSGAACLVGFLIRPLFQQIQIRLGFWVIIPLSLLHLIGAILGLIYTTQEWAVSLEMGSWIAFEAAITIEGLAFDVFGKSELLARQASSTLLAVFTFACALGVTIGGILYDFAGWQGMSIFHVFCQASLVFLFASQPSCRQSFGEFFGHQELEDPDDELFQRCEPTSVVPVEPRRDPATDLVVEDMELPGTVRPAEAAGARTDQTHASGVSAGRTSGMSKGRQSGKSNDSVPRQSGKSGVSARSRRSGQSEQTGQTALTAKTPQSQATGRSAKSNQSHVSIPGWHMWPVRASVASQASRLTRRTLKTEGPGTGSHRSKSTKSSSMTKGTFLSRITALTNLKDSENFQHGFMANNALRPTVATRLGDQDHHFQVDGTESEGSTKSTKGIPKDLRLPAFLVVLCCFNNNLSYVFEFSTFAVFFKEYHGWDAAMWASFAQTAGDLTAAIMMKVLGAATDDDEEAGVLRRLMKQPYSLSCLVFLWILCNLGMTSPWLPLAVTAQVIMGTVYAYTSKLTTDLNLFYSLGDQSVFLSLQVYCKNVEAMGGCLASFLGPLLFETVSPFFPFFVSTALSTVTFILFTSGFCQRLGFPPDIEVAEVQRSRRLGLRRVSAWSVVSRKTLAIGAEKEEL